MAFTLRGFDNTRLDLRFSKFFQLPLKARKYLVKVVFPLLHGTVVFRKASKWSSLTLLNISTGSSDTHDKLPSEWLRDKVKIEFAELGLRPRDSDAVLSEKSEYGNLPANLDEPPVEFLRNATSPPSYKSLLKLWYVQEKRSGLFFRNEYRRSNLE